MADSAASQMRRASPRLAFAADANQNRRGINLRLENARANCVARSRDRSAERVEFANKHCQPTWLNPAEKFSCDLGLDLAEKCTGPYTSWRELQQVATPILRVRLTA